MSAYTQAIDSGGPYNIVAKSYCKRIQVEENFNSVNSPTTDLKRYDPQGNNVVRVVKGTSAIFSAVGDSRYQPGQVVGQLQTESGSITVRVTENDAV